MQRITSILAAGATLGLVSAAMADITITQGDSAPTYGTLLTFDEPGQATGIVPADFWQADFGVTIAGGDGQSIVDDFDEPWIGDGNAFFGNFGIFMTFDNDLTAFSGQIWDPSGPPSPFGGGLAVFVFNDGEQVADFSTEPAWAGAGQEWFDIVATDGMVFDEIRILGFGFDPRTYGDNFSWNVVPGPGALAFLGLGAFARRRRG